MHIPDGFLSTPVAIGAALLGASSVAIAFRRARTHLGPSHVPLLGTTAAFIFAAQMINIPIAAGTSGHFVGAALAAILLGPSAAIVVMTLVLVIQALLFADGGITALGANVLNMAVLPAVLATFVYRISLSLGGSKQTSPAVAGAVAGWVTVVFASALCATEIALSGRAPWNWVFPAMTGWHVFIGILEAAATGAVIATVSAIRPDLIPTANPVRATAMATP